VPPRVVWPQLTARPPSTLNPPSCSLSAQPETESPVPSLHLLLSARADDTRSKPSPPSPPLISCSSTPTVGVPPLTGKLAAPPVPSPHLGVSRPSFPFPLPLQLSSGLISPSLSRSRRCTSEHHRPPSDLPPLPTAVVPISLRHPTVAPPPQ
jgi:hypothetical protein